MNDWLGLPVRASAHAADIDGVTIWVHLLMFVMFIGWSAFFLYMLVRFRRGRHPKADYAGLRTHATRWVEWGVVVAELVLLFGYSVPLWSQRVDKFPPEEQALEVHVTPEQFAWNIHYAGNDGIFGRTKPELVDTSSNPMGIDPADPAGKDDVTTINQLHLPVGRPVIVRLRSKDVIHSFMLNEFRVKQDAIPGLSIPLWFIPTVTTAEIREKTGNPKYDYEIACAQLCGIGHSKMRGFVTVHPAAEFDAWLRGESTKAASSGGDEFWQ
ncbi:MAG TPA: cytochrome c oxidase subunit II [Thermoanaerobaculia bacterium]|nr:cytochrome c oxidase subunit II [Thermoanaerobaculia bacterium]